MGAISHASLELKHEGVADRDLHRAFHRTGPRRAISMPNHAFSPSLESVAKIWGAGASVFLPTPHKVLSK